MANQQLSTWSPTNLGSTVKAWYLHQYNASTGVWTSETGSNNTKPIQSFDRPTSTTINGNTAVNFSGTQYICVNLSSTAFTAGLMSNSFTMWAVCQPANLVNSNGAIIASYVSSGTDTPDRGMSIQTGSYFVNDITVPSSYYNKFTFFAGTAPQGVGTFEGYNTQNVIVNTKTVKVNETYSVIATYNLTTQPMMKFYVNGILVGTNNTHNGTMQSPWGIAPLCIGSAGSFQEINIDGNYVMNPESLFNGKIGNVGFCDTVLSSSDIRQLAWYLSNWGNIPWVAGMNGPASIY